MVCVWFLGVRALSNVSFRQYARVPGEGALTSFNSSRFPVGRQELEVAHGATRNRFLGGDELEFPAASIENIPPTAVLISQTRTVES